MAFINDRQLATLQTYVDRTKNSASKAKEKAQEKAGEMISVMEAAGAAGAMGYARGKFEQADGSWNVPGTKIDMELAIALGGIGAVFFDLFGKYDEHVLSASNGILAHYTGQVARKWAKTGQFSSIAGGYDIVGQNMMLGQFAPNQFNPTQFGSPYSDPVASALAQSGV